MKYINTDNSFKIYLFYPIDRNNEVNFYRALKTYSNIGTEIQAYLIDWEKMDGLPKSFLYVPADYEPFVHTAYSKKLLTQEQITTINCDIIKSCDLLILFGIYQIQPTIQNIEEIKCARESQIPIYSMSDLNPMAIDALKLAIKLIIKARD